MSRTSTDDIPKQDWGYFLDVFSLRHRGWLASLELFGPEFGDQLEANRLRFEGITYEAATGEPEAISIMFGASPDDHIAHAIRKPTCLRVERTELEIGTFETLESESERGPRALVRFPAGVTPEMEPIDD